MKKFSEFTQATSLTNADLLLISQWDGVSAYETKYITANLAESVDKKEFIARIQQTGTSAPTITIIKDDFGDTYTTAYMSAGIYELTGFDSSLNGDEEMYVNEASLYEGSRVTLSNNSADTIGIKSYDDTLTAANDLIGFASATYLHVIQYQ